MNRDTMQRTWLRLKEHEFGTSRPSVRFFIAFGIVVLTGLAISAIVGAQGPPPEISAVSPNPVEPMNKAQPVTVSGRHFGSGLVLRVTGPDGKVAEYKEPVIHERHDGSFVVAADFGATGKYQLVVVNADGGTSNAYELDAKAQTAPVIDAVRPERLQASPTPQTLTLSGQRFTTGISVAVTDPAGNVQTIPESAISDIRATAIQVMATLEIAGEYSVVVTNSRGVTSNAFGFHVDRAGRADRSAEGAQLLLNSTKPQRAS